MATTQTDVYRPQDWFNLALAVLLFLSPWVLGFAGERNPASDAWVVAVLLAIVSISAISALAEWEEWASLVLGIWLIVAPRVLGFTANVHALWTGIVLGALTAAVSIWALWDYRHHTHATA